MFLFIIGIVLVTILPFSIINGIVWYRQRKKYGKIPQHSFAITFATIILSIALPFILIELTGPGAGYILPGIVVVAAILAPLFYAFFWAVYHLATMGGGTLKTTFSVVTIIAVVALEASTGMFRTIIFGSADWADLNGRIVDQYGNGVAGVKILGSSALVRKSKPFEVISANDGSFRISVRGRSISLQKVSKPGYEFKGWHGTITNYPRHNDEQDIAKFTESSPFLIHAWKAEPTPLIHDGANYGFERDGSAYSISLTSGDKYHQGGLNDIQIQFFANPGRIYRGDWKLVMTVPEGGLIKSDDLFMNLAPEDGYQQTVVIEQKEGTLNYKNELTKSFYIRSRSGAIYGRLNMEIVPFYNEYSVIRLEYWLNLNGDRNLTYDKSIELQSFEDSFFEDGKAALKRGEFDKARKLLLLRANNGDRRAMSMIGQMYYNGWGVPRDPSEAFQWFQKTLAPSDSSPGRVRVGAPAGETAFAQRMIALMYRDGVGVARNRQKAIGLLTPIANGGAPLASFDLAELYLNYPQSSGDRILAYCFFRRAEHMTEYFKNDQLAKQSRGKYEALAGKLSGEEIELADSLQLCEPNDAFDSFVHARRQWRYTP